MEIYHYTTIGNLALILKNRNIRFNRLDHFNDLDEGRIVSCGRNLGQYFFASCWTRNSEESIPLWKIYTDNGIGVRICVDEDMFEDYPLPNDPYNILVKGNITTSKIPTEEIFAKGRIVVPVCMKEHGFLQEISYSEDPVKETQDCLKIWGVGDKTNFVFNYNKVGTYKNKRWSFENETRFIIPIIPIKETYPIRSHHDWENIIGYAIYNDIDNRIDDYFLTLKDDVINNIKITLSPKAEQEHYIIVQALLKEYTSNGQVEYSRLRDCVRLT